MGVVYRAIASWDERTIWRMPVAGGEAVQVSREPINSPFDWAPARSGLYCAIRPQPGVCTIQHLASGSSRPTELFRDESVLKRSGLTVSPDERTIFFAAAPGARAERMLVENFREDGSRWLRLLEAA